MGSYLTIVNDTEDTWQCKVGPDMKALKWTMISAVVIVSIAAALGVAVALLPMVTSIAVGGTFGIFGIPIAATLGAAASVGAGGVAAGGATLAGMAIFDTIALNLVKKDYRVIKAGEHQRFGKMTLSLWRQCECIRNSVDQNQVVMNTLMMRPIFSGATAGSTREHSIQWWLNKDGVSKQVIEAHSGPPPSDGFSVVTPAPVVP